MGWFVSFHSGRLGRILRVAQNDKDQHSLTFVILSHAKNPSQAKRMSRRNIGVVSEPAAQTIAPRRYWHLLPTSRIVFQNVAAPRRY